jgi:hypothetical protein
LEHEETADAQKEATMARGPKKLGELFHETLKDIYFAEKKILSALPKLAKAAQHRKRRGQRLAIQFFPACGGAPTFVGIDRGDTDLVCCRWCEVGGRKLAG